MRHILALALLLAAAPAAAQAPADTAAADSLARAGMSGELARSLPVDSLDDVLRLLPGFTAGLEFRGLGAPPAIYLDGVPLRRLLPGRELVQNRGVLPPLTALQRIDVLSADAPVTRGDGAAGIVELRTAAPAGGLDAELSFATDRFAPTDWRRHQNRADLHVGGAVPGVSGLRFLVAGEALGNRYTALPQDFGGLPLYVIGGVDSVFTLPRVPQDSVTVAMPSSTEWPGATAPLGNSDRSSWSAVIGYEPDGAGWDLRASMHGTRRVFVSKPLAELYNPDAWEGGLDGSSVFSLAGRAAFGPWTARGYVSHQGHDLQAGDLDWKWAGANTHPSLGFSSTPRFLATPDDYPADERIAHESRTGALATAPLLNDVNLRRRQGVPGISQPLRLNPYGMRDGWNSTGVGIAPMGYLWRRERHVLAGTALSWSGGRHEVELGGEHDAGTIRGRDVSTFESARSRVAFNDPKRSAVWLQDAFAMGPLSARAGVRLERTDRGGLVPETPGFIETADTSGNFRPTKVSTTVSPRVSARYVFGERLSARGSVGRFYDMRATYGVSHDPSAGLASLAWVSGNEAFLDDVDPPRIDLAEIGVSARLLRNIDVDAVVYRAAVEDAFVVRRESFTNPVTDATVFLPLWTNAPDGTQRQGLELTARTRLGSAFAGIGSYALESGDDPVKRPHSAAAILAFEPATRTTLLSDIGVYATASYRSGLPYTRLANRGTGALTGERIPLGSIPAGELNASRTPSETRFDLRATTGFRVGGRTLRLSADLRNPLGIVNTRAVYAETGTVENELYRARRVQEFLAGYLATGTVEDTVIDELTLQNDLNRYALLAAERRFGDGDGIFTVEEQTRVAEAYFDLTNGVQWLRSADRMLRIGVEVTW